MSGENQTKAGPLTLVGDYVEDRAIKAAHFVEHVGGVSQLAWKTFRTLVTTRLEWNAFVYQMEQLGVRSLAIASATSIFVGMVMTIQFGYFAALYGAKDGLGRMIVISEARELAPSLTSLVVGCRIAAGMAAELGSMAVTEQIDAIRALGADPIRKLVVPRVLAGIFIMPLLSSIAFVLGMVSAMFIASTLDVAPDFFISASLDSVQVQDVMSGIAKTPFFGFLITMVGCYFGITTTGGTEGVGQSTTRSVVVSAITLLIADALLTQLFVSL
ncbi:MAG: ABC transporter permease [Polyangiales bacterium]